MAYAITPPMTLPPPRQAPAGLDGPAPALRVLRHRLRYALHPATNPMRHFAPTRTLYIRLPKNASNSIMAVLYPGTPPAALPHFSALYYRRLFPRAFQRHFVFAPLRHPLDRFASAFTYYRQTSRNPAERHMMDRTLPHLRTLEDFVLWLNDQPDLESVPILRWHHFLRQTSYICDTRGRVLTDLLFPVEEMEEGIALLEDITGRRARIGRLNASRPHSTHGLPMDRIRAHYADDLRLWEQVMRRRLLLFTDPAGLARRVEPAVEMGQHPRRRPLPGEG